MKAPVFVLLCSAIVSSLFAETVDVYFGTGTSPEAIGIFHAKFDPETGKIGERTLAAKIKQPEFLAVHPNGSHLYAVAKNDEPVLAAYDIMADGSLELLNTVPMSNGQGAHLAVHPSGKFLITAQYFSSSVGVFSLTVDGSIGEQTQVLPHVGPTGIHRRQSHPRPHWTGFSPDGKFALVPDLGTDKIHFYRVNAVGTLLTPHSVAASGPGSGPRHLRFSHNGKFIHLMNELTVSVSTFAYDAAHGTAILQHTVPCLSPFELAQNVLTTASEILVHPTGNFIYTANRGHDSITVFRTDPATGKLTEVENESVRGAWPRNIRIDPTGQWLFVSGEDSNTISMFVIDQKTGELTFPKDSTFNLPSVYSILFKE